MKNTNKQKMKSTIVKYLQYKSYWNASTFITMVINRIITENKAHILAKFSSSKYSCHRDGAHKIIQQNIMNQNYWQLIV